MDCQQTDNANQLICPSDNGIIEDGIGYCCSHKCDKELHLYTKLTEDGPWVHTKICNESYDTLVKFRDFYDVKAFY